MIRCSILLVAMASFCAVALPADPSPWPQFRGPDGQGHVAGSLPTSWSEGNNVAWKTPLPGKGWSSPVIAGGKAWMTTAVPTTGDGLSLRMIGVDLKSGDIKHDVELFTVDKPPELHARNTAASPTPVVIGNRVVASFGNAGIGCIDAGTGKVLWRNDKYKVDYQTGPGSSPVPYKDRIILPCDGADAQFVVALDAETGKEAWRRERDAAVKKAPNARRAFSTPLVITAGGKDQVVIPGAQCVYSYDPNTGKELWRVTYVGFSNVPRPVFANGLVIISTGYYFHELLAIRPDGSGDVTATHIAWRFKKSVPNVSSPVVHNRLLFMVADNGSATCLDARTGAMKWTERLPGKYTAAPLVCGNTVYIFSDEGKTVLLRAADAFDEIARNDIDGRIQATPAAFAGGLLLRSDTTLYFLTSRE